MGVDYITEQTTYRRAVGKAGRTFQGGVAYASTTEKAEWVHLRGVISVETAAIEMEATAALIKRCQEPNYHQQWVTEAFALEGQMFEARTLLRDQIPHVE